MTMLTEEQRMIAEGVRAFVEKELQPHEAMVERLDNVPDDLFRDIQRKAIANGYYALNMPEQHGGGGLGSGTSRRDRIRAGKSTLSGVICNRPAPILKSCVGDQSKPI